MWLETWINCRLAAENTFLWQLIYRIPATNRWRHPDRNATDPDTWCPRCQLNTPEDVFHCIWDCRKSQECWQWCSTILRWTSTSRQQDIRLLPAQVFIADNLPVAWETPARLWHTLRAVMCWGIWKERNHQVFRGDIFCTRRVMIGLAWHRIGMYISAAWSSLLTQVQLHRLTLAEARDRMDCFFGAERKLWILQDIKIQIAPVPPRPP